MSPRLLSTLDHAKAADSDAAARPTRPPLAGPIRLDTVASSQDQSNPGIGAGPVPAHPPTLTALSGSPKIERLPSFRQIVKLADGAGEDKAIHLQYPPPPSSYPPSVTAQSSALPHHPFIKAAHSSPGYGFPPVRDVRDASTHHDAHMPHSPTTIPFSASGPCYAPAMSRESEPTNSSSAPPSLRTIPTTSSSGESSYGHRSSVGGTSTAQTTPLETPDGPLEATGQPKFPVDPTGHQDYPESSGQPKYPVEPPSQQDYPEPSRQHHFSITHNLPRPTSSAPPTPMWYCDEPGCTAAPFSTQYLLNSHSTSHSAHRPHYCPRPGCPRGEGGKGFKRKNEMIRHGLTHETPGYVCPFCTDRAHSYPRPDNLQRHVRVHHIDKDKDDPVLREVLGQRSPGMGASGSGLTKKRRRTGP